MLQPLSSALVVLYSPCQRCTLHLCPGENAEHGPTGTVRAQEMQSYSWCSLFGVGKPASTTVMWSIICKCIHMYTIATSHCVCCTGAVVDEVCVCVCVGGGGVVDGWK